MKICIGIPTHERLDLLEITAKTLSLLEDHDAYEIRIYDDASTTFSREKLSKLFPKAEKIVIRDSCIGADRNTYQMYEDFMTSDADSLFCVDSDLLVHPVSLDVIKRVLPETDGVLSVYNSCSHKHHTETTLAGEKVLCKSSIGSAGVVFSRELLVNILKNVPSSNSIDWDWSRYCVEEDIRLCVTQKSYVQHLGFLTGYNANQPDQLDFGENFFFGNPKIDSILAESLSKSILDESTGIQARVGKIYDSYSFRIGKTLIWPAKTLRRKMFSGS